MPSQEPLRLARLFMVLHRHPGLARKVKSLHFNLFDHFDYNYRAEIATVERVLSDLVEELSLPRETKLAWLEASNPHTGETNSQIAYEALGAGLLALVPNVRRLELGLCGAIPLLSTLALLPSRPIL
ncbi:uncharacterized protein BDZ99DRAFT_522205 [Mytilinidion resinicola]|uniref:Uncharacterized protein n=1 Tax=Mytilinidion resinicola TaxID=574789 RepID=A0A6A6YGB4_9PEZI|nr:uncharacterized protein BDZ99DRAFT_522205 [Mytilinidion resinicola]KAF2807573.1 hypothetical protein BDZ99DRAFT_522205 [Mytilinidion resinicola]